MPFSSTRIRPLVVAVIRRKNNVLAVKGYDKSKNQCFYRLLGGGIEFGETAEDALRREFREELGVEITNLRRLEVVENIFIYENQAGHEIVFVYEAEFADKNLYEQEKLFFCEEERAVPYAEWINTQEKNIYPQIDFFNMGIYLRCI